MGSRGVESMPKRSRVAMTMRKTPIRTSDGALDAAHCKRPAFSLGKISFGGSSDCSSRSDSPCLSNADSNNDEEPTRNVAVNLAHKLCAQRRQCGRSTEAGSSVISGDDFIDDYSLSSSPPAGSTRKPLGHHSINGTNNNMSPERRRKDGGSGRRCGESTASQRAGRMLIPSPLPARTSSAESEAWSASCEVTKPACGQSRATVVAGGGEYSAADDYNRYGNGEACSTGRAGSDLGTHDRRDLLGESEYNAFRRSPSQARPSCCETENLFSGGSRSSGARPVPSRRASPGAPSPTTRFTRAKWSTGNVSSDDDDYLSTSEIERFPAKGMSNVLPVPKSWALSSSRSSTNFKDAVDHEAESPHETPRTLHREDSYVDDERENIPPSWSVAREIGPPSPGATRPPTPNLQRPCGASQKHRSGSSQPVGERMFDASHDDESAIGSSSPAESTPPTGGRTGDRRPTIPTAEAGPPGPRRSSPNAMLVDLAHDDDSCNRPDNSSKVFDIGNNDSTGSSDEVMFEGCRGGSSWDSTLSIEDVVSDLARSRSNDNAASAAVSSPSTSPNGPRAHAYSPAIGESAGEADDEWDMLNSGRTVVDGAKDSGAHSPGFSLISSPRVSLAGSRAAVAAQGERYDDREAESDWQQAAASEGGDRRWELQHRQRGMRTAFSVPAKLYDRMYPHQQEGVKWLWTLHQGGMGGILGDDMGLGKTFQVCCLLAGLFSTEQAKCALIVAPKSVMPAWETELRAWLIKACCPLAEVYVARSEMALEARRLAINMATKGGFVGDGAVVITTYGIVSANPSMFDPPGAGESGRPFMWDYVVLDEGHRIKNCSTRTCKSVHEIPTRRRLLLTGTPVQNNLKELYTVVDWATFGGLLGPYNHFKSSFSRPIENGQDKDASEYVVTRSKTMAAELRKLLAPYLLQRNKGEIWDEKAVTKTELVLWVALSTEQRDIYAKYLGGESVKDVLAGRVLSPLAAIQHLKKVCLHPTVSSFPLEHPWHLDMDASVSQLIRASPKLSVLLRLVKKECGDGNRVLVFSRSVRMLDIIQRCLNAEESEGGAGFGNVRRIDGSHSDMERQQTIKSFNGGLDIPVCLISTGAGGTGITLTGANRVVLFDPSWNPADDMQAVDRAYRIGQMRDVIVYRMIAAGTVEEKIYEKQVFKDGLRRTIMGGSGKRKKNHRYFSRAELKQLFTLCPPGECRVLQQLDQMHGTLRSRMLAAESPAQQALAVPNGPLDFVCDLRGSYGASAHSDGLPKIVNASSAIPTPDADNPHGMNLPAHSTQHCAGNVDSENEYESAAEEYDGEPLLPAGGGGGSGGGVRLDVCESSEDESGSDGARRRRERRRSGVERGPNAVGAGRSFAGRSRVLTIDDSDSEELFSSAVDARRNGGGLETSIGPLEIIDSPLRSGDRGPSADRANYELCDNAGCQRKGLVGDDDSDTDKDGCSCDREKGGFPGREYSGVGAGMSLPLFVDDTDSNVPADEGKKRCGSETNQISVPSLSSPETELETDLPLSEKSASMNSPSRPSEDDDRIVDMSFDEEVGSLPTPATPALDLAEGSNDSPGVLVDNNGRSVSSDDRGIVHHDMFASFDSGDGLVDTPPTRSIRDMSLTAASEGAEKDLKELRHIDDRSRKSAATRWDIHQSMDNNRGSYEGTLHEPSALAVSSPMGTRADIERAGYETRDRGEAEDIENGDEQDEELDWDEGNEFDRRLTVLSKPTSTSRANNVNSDRGLFGAFAESLLTSKAAPSPSPVDGGRERARQWPREELSMSPAASYRSSMSFDGQKSDSDVERDDAAAHKAKVIAAARERARKYATEELGMDVDELADSESISFEEDSMRSIDCEGKNEEKRDQEDEEGQAGGLLSPRGDCDARDFLARDDCLSRSPSRRRSLNALTPVVNREAYECDRQTSVLSSPTRLDETLMPQAAVHAESSDNHRGREKEEQESVASPEAGRGVPRRYLHSSTPGASVPSQLLPFVVRTPEEDTRHDTNGNVAVESGGERQRPRIRDSDGDLSDYLFPAPRNSSRGPPHSCESTGSVHFRIDRLSIDSYETARGSAVACLLDDLREDNECDPSADNDLEGDNHTDHVNERIRDPSGAVMTGLGKVLTEHEVDTTTVGVKICTHGEDVAPTGDGREGASGMTPDNRSSKCSSNSGKEIGSQGGADAKVAATGAITMDSLADAVEGCAGDKDILRKAATSTNTEEDRADGRGDEGSSPPMSTLPMATPSPAADLASHSADRNPSATDTSDSNSPARPNLANDVGNVVASAACAEHRAVAAQYGFTCNRCRCVAGAEDAEKSRAMVERAGELQKCGQSIRAMGMLLAAVELCDDDRELHRSIKGLAERVWGKVLL